MAFVGMQMLDKFVFITSPASLEPMVERTALRRSLPLWDTGSALIDKSNVDSFLQAKQSATSAPK